MTLPRLSAIGKHWEKVPPLSVSVYAIAVSLGMKRPEKKAQQDPQQLMELFGAQGFKSEKPAWLQKQKS